MFDNADGIVRALRETGVSHIFGIPSIHNIGFYDALRKDSSIRHIVCRHEAGATHMADGYARRTGGLGVIVSSTGPGAGFTISALQEAWGSCSPVLMITSNIDANKIGKGLGVLHELEEQSSLFRTITKEVIRVGIDDDFYQTTRRAISLALNDRPGPVCLEIPTNLMSREAHTDPTGPSLVRNSDEPLPSEFDRAIALLRNAKQPVILAGTDAARSTIGPDLQALAESMCAPIITNSAGKGVVPEDHHLAFGNCARKLVVEDIVPQCDVALVIGSRLREVDAKRRGLKLPSKLIHLDWDDRWIGRNFEAAVPLVGDLPSLTKTLRKALEGEPYSGPRQDLTKKWARQSHEQYQLLQKQLQEIQSVSALRAVIPRDAALVIDNTQLGYWAEYFFPSYHANGIIGAKGSGLLGFSFPAAIGAKLARPNQAVVGVIGDGGFMYTAQELATCVHHNIGFPLIVVNDDAFGVIGYLQRSAYGHAYQEQLTNPDFLKFAEAFGIQANRVDSPAELRSTLDDALSSGEMRLIEYRMSIQEPPFGKY